MEGYRTSYEHLIDELCRLDLRLNLQIFRQRQDPTTAGFDEFRGLFISEEEIDLILGSGQKRPHSDGAGHTSEMSLLLSAIEQHEQQIAQRAVMALEQGVELMLPRLARHFDLAPFDVDVLLICLAPELDLKYEKLYAYLQNDVTRKSPTVGLALDLFCSSFDQKLVARRRLMAEAPLIRHQLITVSKDGQPEAASLLSCPLKIDDRILNYFFAVDTMDEKLTTCSKLVSPSARLTEIVYSADFKERLINFFQSRINQVDPADRSEDASAQVFLFHGRAGVGKKFTAEALCRSTGLNMLVADMPEMLLTSMKEPSLMVRLFREAKLQSAAIFLDHIEALFAESEPASRARRDLFKALTDFPGIVFAGSTQLLDSSAYPQVGTFFNITFPAPDYSLRTRLWQTYLNENGHPVSAKVTLEDFAGKFNFTAGKIRNAIDEARRLALLRDHDSGEISVDDLYQACRAQSSTKLSTLARKITPLYTWDDITLPYDSLQQLKEICSQAEYRQQVFDQWGFERKMSLGKGLSVLFVGPSGTGKTMAAEIMAGDLHLDLYKIDLSGVVSKYIGETEKNLNKIFEEAEQSNAILFFDEADALFGKRSQVRDSHDRYANIEINYLLQKMEEYEGITILASNFKQNIDEAFTRRLRFIVEFPFPDEPYRYRIWQHIFPQETPLSDDIDFDFLARKLRLTGGNIRNIALNTAFLAAASSGRVDMEHIIRTTKREFQKMGRLCVKADFEQYYEWVMDDE